jgi:hypothetical protein
MSAFRSLGAVSFLVAVVTFAPSVGYADEALDWNRIATRAVFVPPVTPPPLAARILAMTQAAVFDAHNGIERRFEHIRVAPNAERGASRRAAVVQAAYAVLVAEYPAQEATLTAERAASLAAIAEGEPDPSRSIDRGIAWGQYVAEQIRAWRASDGVFPLVPYAGSTVTGKWRPTPPAFAPGFGITLGQAVPFVVPTPSTFRPAGPPSLSSAEYAADVNEVKRVGERVTSERTADQTQAATFWGGTAPTFWNRAAVAAAEARGTSLSYNARLLALLNMALADAVFTVWESKYFFDLWRPITAIQLASTDGNDATIEQADWTPLLNTPAYPDHFSGHQGISGTAAAILTAHFGASPFSGYSEGAGTSVRSWPSFEAAADEAFMARIWSGIHFRFAMSAARSCALEIAAYVLEHAARPLNGTRTGQVPQ